MSDLWNTKEVADFLGIDTKTVTQRLIEKDKLPSYKVGGQFRFEEKEVKEWFNKQRTN